jgi:2-dehydropantoate 2-reductase
MSPRVQQLAALFDKARGVKAKAVPNAMQEMWEKLVHLSVSASMTCLMRAPVGDILRTPYGQELFMRMLESAEAVATHHGYPPRPEYKKWCRELFSQPDSLYGTSMLRDIERGGPTEGEHIVGDMVRRAQAAGVDDTLFRIAYTHLKAYENRRAAGRL